jgi:hypothetical protein
VARVGSQDLRRRLHLGQVDHQELLEIVLAHFGHGEQPEASVFSYGRQGQPAQLIFKMGRLGHIADVTPGPGFMKRDIDEVAAKIRHTLLGEQPVRVGRVIAFSTEPVRGVFRYRDRFQMLPMPSGAPAPREGLIADQPFVLEVSYASCPEDWIGFSRQAKAVMMHTRLLAVLSNQHVWHSNQARFGSCPDAPMCQGGDRPGGERQDG